VFSTPPIEKSFFEATKVIGKKYPMQMINLVLNAKREDVFGS
jgi:hypothetical protein